MITFVFVLLVIFLFMPSNNKKEFKNYTIEEMMFYDWLFEDDD